MVPMVDEVYDALMLQKERQESDKQKYREIYMDQGLVFADMCGDYLPQRQFMDKYHAFLRKYDITDIRFHDLRHPYVKHKTKSFLRNSRVFKADFCAPSHSLCTEVFHFPDNINLISGVNIHTFNQCVSQGGI